MAYKLFLSHSFSDRNIVRELRSSFSQPGIELYVAEVDPRYGQFLPSKIERAIDACDAVLVILTRKAGESASVNQEIGYAKRAHKRIIALVEDGANVGVLLQGIEYLAFSIDKLAEAIDRIVHYVQMLVKAKDKDDLLELSLTIVVIAILGVVVLMLLSRKK